MSSVTHIPPGNTRDPLRRRATLIGLRSHHVTPEQARELRRAAETDRKILPRRQPGDGLNGWHTRAPAGAYSRVIEWRNRWHWLNIVIPLALSHQRGRAALAHQHVSRDTFRRWARIESLYALEQATGRRVIVRPDDVAQLGEVGCERTVQRCRAAARELGLLVDVSIGRHLNRAELAVARPHYTEQGWRRRWSKQMGLCSESACAVPRWMPPLAWLVSRGFGGHVTPTEGPASRAHHLGRPRGSLGASGGRTARQAERLRRTGPPRSEGRPPDPASDPLRAAQRRAWALARDLTQMVPWLRGEAPGRMVPALMRFVTCSPRWTAADMVTAIDAKHTRLGWSAISPARVRTRPAVVLARVYLADFDPQADHPRLEIRARRDAAPPWCGQCQRRTRLVEIDDGRLRRCPSCHPHREDESR